MTRPAAPRIRTLKPELWANERVGTLSRDARLLFVGLITMADDEGRLRDLPGAIRGHVAPYDEVGIDDIDRWLDEVAAAGLVLRYAIDDRRYAVLLGWHEHQKINRPTESAIPEPPQSSSLRNHGAFTESSVPPRAQARADPLIPDPSVDPSVSVDETNHRNGPSRTPAPAQPHLPAPAREAPRSDAAGKPEAANGGQMPPEAPPAPRGPPSLHRAAARPRALTYGGRRVSADAGDKARRAFAAYRQAANRQRLGELTGDGRPSTAFKQVLGAVLEHEHVAAEDWERQIYAFVASPPDWVSSDPPQIGHVFGARAVQWMLDPGAARQPANKGDASLRAYNDWFEEIRAKEESNDRT